MRISRLIIVIGISVLLMGVFLYPVMTGAQQSRGQGVRIRVENGREIDLYDESHALVIGVSRYDGGWRPLPGVSKDVEEVARVLRGQGFRVTEKLDLTRAEFDTAVREFTVEHGQGERNRLVIYFAGHGHTERLTDGRDVGYLVMKNAPLPERERSKFELSTISMDEVDSYARRIKSKHALFIFDSCFSGSVLRGEESKVPAEILSRTAGPVRQFITSGTANQRVPDESIFRRYFVRAFEQRLGDLNGDGFITGEELGMYLKGNVSSDSHDTQTPVYGKIREAKLNEGDVVFELAAKPVVTAAPTETVTRINPCEKEEEAWSQVRASRKVAVVQEFLLQFPNCGYARNARILLADIMSGPGIANTTAQPVVKIEEKKSPYQKISFKTGTLVGKAFQERQGECELLVEDLGEGVKLEMVRVEGGSFRMGSEPGEAGRAQDEGPVHSVTVGEFLIGRYEVTQAQWAKVARYPKVAIELSPAPSRFKGDRLPVEQVSWNEAREFVARLNKHLGLGERGGYRLPSEAEWEYAARAGSTTLYAWGESITSELANFGGVGTKNVGGFRPNAFGLYDMHGNVWEWCEDDWHGNYEGAPADGSAWVDGNRGGNRVLRGGSWSSFNLRSAFRNVINPDFRDLLIGFRVVVGARS